MLIAAVSDGAGTASRSDAGAALAVDYFLRKFAAAVQDQADLSTIDRTFVDEWLDAFRQEIAGLAETDGADSNDYACTLLGAVIGNSRSAYVQIGDGAIVVADEEVGEYVWIFWPQHGEYANSTYFLTQDGAGTALQFETGPSVNEVAIFSDGIERLVLDHAAKTVHAPAFRPIFGWLARTEPGAAGVSSPVLATYLASEQVNRRTDDDKTLVMATRLTPEELAA